MTANLMRKILGFSTAAWLCMPAVAQFEISPDHFDEPLKAEISQPAKPQSGNLTKIHEQQRLLKSYNARIKAKLLEVDAAFEDLIKNGNGAGQAEAYWIHQRELEKLIQDLALPISEAQKRLVSLQRNFARGGQNTNAGGERGKTKNQPAAIGSRRYPAPALTTALTEAR